MNYIPLDYLNQAKQKINSLLMAKYVGEDDAYSEVVDEEADTKMVEINSKLDECIKNLFTINNIITIASNDANKYDFRNGNTGFGEFTKAFYSLSNNVKYAIDTLKPMMSSIGYIEPGNINDFYKKLNEINNTYQPIYTKSIRNGAFNYKPVKDKLDTQYIKNIIEVTKSDLDTLMVIKQDIYNTYNYKTESVAIKKNPSSYSGNNDEEDDEEYIGGSNSLADKRFEYLKFCR